MNTSGKYINSTEETENEINQLNTQIHSKSGCEHFNLSITQPNPSKLELWLKNKEEPVSHVMIGCEYAECANNALRITTTTEPPYQRQNYNKFLTAIVIIIASSLIDKKGESFMQIVDYTTVKARMNVLQKYVIYKTDALELDPMSQEEKDMEIIKEDGKGLFSIYIPLFYENMETHLNQEIARKLIHALLEDNKNGIMCSRTNRGGKKTKRRKRKKGRRSNRIFKGHTRS
jgi:hypothetical protein